MHTVCCAQADYFGPDGNRYRLAADKEPSDCGIPDRLDNCAVTEGERCNQPSRMVLDHDDPESRSVPVCDEHYVRHLDGDDLWVYLQPR